MTSIMDIGIMDEFRESIPVNLSYLGTADCIRYKRLYEKSTEGRPDADTPESKGRFLTAVLVDALRDWIENQEKLERVPREKKEVKAGRVGGQGRGRGRPSLDVVPHAAE